MSGLLKIDFIKFFYLLISQYISHFMILNYLVSSKLVSSKPKLASLPPTTEVFEINVLRAHFQVCNWISWMSENLSNMDPCEVSISSNKILFLNSYSKIILA